MQLSERECPVCARAVPFKVVHEANYDLSKLDDFAFSSRKFPENMHFRLVQCSGCDLLFANPAPRAEDLIAAYEVAAYDSGAEADFASATYARYLKKHLGLFTERRGALDIGSGNGSFLEHLIDLGFSEVVGVEPSRAPIDAAKPTIRPLLRHAPFRAEDFAKESLALVTCFQTLEHVYDPGAMTKQIWDILRPGGAVYFVAHNYQAPLNRALGTRSPIYDVEHAQLFSPGSMEKLLQSAGFSSVHTFPIVNAYPLPYWVRLAPLPRSLKVRVVEGLKRAGLGGFPIALPVGNTGIVGVKVSRPH